MVSRNQRLRVGVFSQHHVDGMQMKKSALEQVSFDFQRCNLRKKRLNKQILKNFAAPFQNILFDPQFKDDYPSDPPQKIRQHLGSMGVVGAFSASVSGFSCVHSVCVSGAIFITVLVFSVVVCVCFSNIC